MQGTVGEDARTSASHRNPSVVEDRSCRRDATRELQRCALRRCGKGLSIRAVGIQLPKGVE